MSFRSAALLATSVAFLALGCAREPARIASVPPAPSLQTFEATAYSIKGKTAAGTRSREGIVAADSSILPLGSRIRLHDAGEYSGEYVVEDTGRAIKGREIDLYLASAAKAKRFGRRSVQLEVLERGRR